jgi:hypothetical protein
MTDEELKNMKLSEEDLKESTYFTEGVHAVTITEASFEKNPNDKVFLNVKVESVNGEQGEARLWFTGAATPFSVDKIRKIFVHNAKDDDQKQKVRDFFKNMKSLYEMSQLVQKLPGKSCWYTIQKTEETYIDNNGDEKYRYERSIWAYEPKLKNKSEKSTEDITEDIDISEPVDLSEIPF